MTTPDSLLSIEELDRLESRASVRKNMDQRRLREGQNIVNSLSIKLDTVNKLLSTARLAHRYREALEELTNVHNGCTARAKAYKALNKEE